MGALLTVPVLDGEGDDGNDGLKWGAYEVQGWRIHMEDAYLSQVINGPNLSNFKEPDDICDYINDLYVNMKHEIMNYNEKSDSKDGDGDNNNNNDFVDLHLFGVMDGHAGGGVSKFVAKYLPIVLKNNIHFKVGEWKIALKESFLLLDKMVGDDDFREEIEKLHMISEEKSKLAGDEAKMEFEEKKRNESKGKELIVVDNNSKDNENNENDEHDENKNNENDEHDENKNNENDEKDENNNNIENKNNNNNDENKNNNNELKSEDKNNDNKVNIDLEKYKEDNKSNTGDKKVTLSDALYDLITNQSMTKLRELALGEKKTRPPLVGGCTAVIVLKTPDNYLVVANVGDSRAVLCRDGVAIPLSNDHKPTDNEEKERIENAGAKITFGGRINNGLNLSRAIGDLKYKTNPNLPAEKQAVTSNPEITITKLKNEDEFIIIACDGIWDCRTNQLAVNYFRRELYKNQLENNENKKKMSEIIKNFLNSLIPKAKTNGMGTDNMTCLVVKLKENLPEIELNIKTEEKNNESENKDEDKKENIELKDNKNEKDNNNNNENKNIDEQIISEEK